MNGMCMIENVYIIAYWLHPVNIQTKKDTTKIEGGRYTAAF